MTKKTKAILSKFYELNEWIDTLIIFSVTIPVCVLIIFTLYALLDNVYGNQHPLIYLIIKLFYASVIVYIIIYFIIKFIYHLIYTWNVSKFMVEREEMKEKQYGN